MAKTAFFKAILKFLQHTIDLLLFFKLRQQQQPCYHVIAHSFAWAVGLMTNSYCNIGLICFKLVLKYNVICAVYCRDIAKPNNYKNHVF